MLDKDNGLLDASAMYSFVQGLGKKYHILPQDASVDQITIDSAAE